MRAATQFREHHTVTAVRALADQAFSRAAGAPLIGWPRTYPGVLPFLRLDHIYFDTSLVLEGATLYRSRTALIASDHLPIVADFRLGHTSSTRGIEGNERKTGKDAS